MKRIAILFFGLAIAMTSHAQTYKWILLKNAGATDTTYADGKAWYNPTYNHFTFIENGTAKHLGSNTSLPALSPGYIYVGNGSSVATPVPLSGDGSLSSAGVLTITGLQTKSIPSLSTGLLKYSGGSFSWDNTTYLTSANNGLSLSGTTAQLGGALTGNTSIGTSNVFELDILASVTWLKGTTITLGGGSTNDLAIFANNGVKFTAPLFAGTTLFSPLILKSGPLVSGAFGAGLGGFGFDGTHLYFGIGSTQYQLDQQSGSGGTVTSVAQSFTGGLISVGGSPITSIGTFALTVAGTSGGIPYFSSSSTWASSAALTANALMIGGGAGAAPSTTTTGAGILTWLATPSWTNFNSAITGTAPFWNTGGTTTLISANTIASTTPSDLNFTDTWTATANNQYAVSHALTLTSRSSASDAINGLVLTGSITAASTGIVASPLLINTSFKTNSGITTGTGATSFSTGSATVSKTVAGMTATTYTSVAPASTSGSGTGALFTVIVSNATTFTSFNCTTSGSGYNYGETITFNGSQFGGSGSVVLSITSTVNSLGANAAPILVTAPVGDYVNITTPIFTALSAVTGSSIFKIAAVSPPINAVGTPGVQFSDLNGSFITTASGGVSFSRAVTGTSAQFSTIGTTVSGSSFAGSNTFTGANFAFGTTSNGHLQFSGSGLAVAASGVVKSYIYGTGGVTTGLPTTYTISAGGTGYSAGNFGVTGGTGSGAILAITVSGGVVQTATPVYSTSAGTGYSVGDVLTIVAGGNNATATVATVDQFGGVVTMVSDSRALTDAKSNNSYTSYFSNPTYTLASSSASTYFGYYNPTYSSFGSGTKGGLVIVPSAALNAFGTATPLSTVDIVGSLASNITLSTGNLTLDATHATIIITSGTGTYTLPAASGATRRIYRIVNQTGGARTTSTYLDKSAASQTTVGANSVIYIQSDGSNWYQIN